MPTSWKETISIGSLVKAEHIEELRTAIRAEIITRRKLGTFTPAEATVTPGMSIKAAHTQEIINQMNKVNSSGVSVTPEGAIFASTIVLLRNKLNEYESRSQYGTGHGCGAACAGFCSSCTGSCTGGCAAGCTGCRGGR